MTVRTTLGLIASAVLAGNLLGGCADDRDEPRRLRVVASIGVIADAVRVVGGDRVETHTLVGPGADPHQYRLQPQDLETLNAADLIFLNGLGLEAAMSEALAHPDLAARTIVVSDGIDRDELLPAAPNGETFDPHVWLDLRVWMSAIQAVADALTRFDSAAGSMYLGNAASYQQQLVQLEQWMTARVLEIPEEHRVLITAHRAFDYLGRSLGLETVGLLGTAITSGNDIAGIDRVTAVVLATGIPAIFAETSLPRRALDAVSRRVEARGGSVEVDGPLYSDALGQPGTVEATYIGMMGHNVNAIVDGLTGSVLPAP